MRTLTKLSTAKCTLEHYTAFLLAEPLNAGCVRLAERHLAGLGKRSVFPTVSIGLS